MFIDKHIHPRIRKWFYTQMTYWLRYVLNTTDCDGAVDQSFDEMLEEMYREYESRHDKYDNECPPKFTAPSFNCLWDVLFNKLGDDLYNYMRLLSAYRAKYGFTTKDQIYHHMINELDAWIDTVNDRNDIITIALGMSINMNIFDVFYKFNSFRHKYSEPSNFYDNLLNALIQINFDATNLSIDYWYYIEGMTYYPNVKPYTPHVHQITDLQSVYASHIISFCRYLIHTMKSDGDLSCVDDESDDDSDDYSDDADYDPGTIQDCIKLLADDMGIYSSHSTKYYLKQYGRINNITDKWQILDHIKAAIGPYPKKLEPVLELYRTHRFKFYCMSDQWYKYYTIMTELIDFDTIPITLIDLHFPIKQTPKYCAKLANTYTGSRTKAAKREDSY